jgi:hypothetical protein
MKEIFLWMKKWRQATDAQVVESFQPYFCLIWNKGWVDQMAEYKTQHGHGLQQRTVEKDQGMPKRLLHLWWLQLGLVSGVHQQHLHQGRIAGYATQRTSGFPHWRLVILQFGKWPYWRITFLACHRDYFLILQFCFLAESTRAPRRHAIQMLLFKKLKKFFSNQNTFYFLESLLWKTTRQERLL